MAAVDISGLHAHVGETVAETLASVPHGFLGRSGGVSTGELSGLNVGYGSNDDRDAIEENRRRAVATSFMTHTIRSAIAPRIQVASNHETQLAASKRRALPCIIA